MSVIAAKKNNELINSFALILLKINELFNIFDVNVLRPQAALL